MDLIVMPFLKAFCVTGLVCMGLAFTPFDIIPLIFSLPSYDWSGLAFLLYLLGLPCGGYLMALLFPGETGRIRSVSGLTGFWTGAIGGSVLGLAMAGDA